MCNVACATELCCLIFVIISFPLYIVFIAVLIKNRNQDILSSPFYRIVTALGVVDLLTVCHYFVFLRSMAWSIFVPMHRWGGSLLVKYWVTVSMGGQRCQQLLVLATTLNRYVALNKPMEHDSIWTPSHTNRAIALCLLLGYGSHLHIPTICHIIVAPTNNGTGLFPVWSDACWKYTPLGSSALLTFTLSIIFIIFYTLMFGVVWRQAKNTVAKSAAAVQKDKASRNTAVIGGVLSSLVLCHAFVYGAIGVSPAFHKEHLDVFLVIITVQFTLFSMINPWLILACASKVRLAFFQFIGIH